jgi:hypothetical protein
MLLLNKSSDERSTSTRDTTQNNTIENIILDMRTIRANSESCKYSMGKNFQEIGKYEPSSSTVIENDVYLKEIVSIVDSTDPSITPRSPKYRATFIKKNKAKKTQREKSEFFRIQKFVTEVNGAVNETCSSYEVAGVDNSMKSFCDAIGANFINSTGKCDASSIDPTQYTDSLGKETCLALGGTHKASGHCSGINLPDALITTSHFGLNSIMLTGKGKKTGYQNKQCSGIEVSSGLTEDGGVTCSAIVCPQVNTEKDGSSYEPAFNSDANIIECQCTRDRGIELDCGSKDVDSCAAYTVADGCGTGNLCNMLRGKPTTGICENGDTASDMYTDEACWDKNGCRDAKDRIRGTMCRPDYSCALTTDEGDTCSDGCGGTVDGVREVIVAPPIVVTPKPGGGSCSEGSTRNSLVTCCLMQYLGRKKGCAEPGTFQEVCRSGSWSRTVCQ